MLPLSTIPSYFRSTLIPQILNIPLSIMAILKPSSASVGSEVSKELAVVLAQRGSLARIVALVANERLLHIVYKPTEKLYYISPLISSSSPERAKRERFILSGMPPFLTLEVDVDGNLVQDLMHESNVLVGTWPHH